jgi:Flp pilus assembly protein TadD
MTHALLRTLLSCVLFAAFVAASHRPSVDRSNVLTLERCEVDPLREARALEACLSARPDDVEIMFDLAAAYEASNEWQRAEDLYRRALDVDSLDAEAHLRLGRILKRRGDHALARREGELALALRPNSAEALALIGP